MRMRKWVLFIGLFITMVAQATVYTPASVPNPKNMGQDFYVATPDAILPDSSVTWLNNCAARLEQATQVQLCVVALESIGESEAFDFAYELFQRWGLGREGRNTGVLMLFVLDSHDIRIMTGVGIEGVLTDAQCSKIIHDDMIPAFREEMYGDGLCLGALRIYELCTDGEAPEELLAIRSVTNRGQYAQNEEATLEDILVDIFILLLIIALIAFVIWNTKNHGNDKHFGTGVGGPMGMGGFGGGSSFGGGFSGGSWGGGSTMGGGAGGKW